MKRQPPAAPRAVLSNWKGFPCPTCAQPLQYWMDEAGADGKAEGKADGKKVKVLLVCPQKHCWQEELALDTLHSSLFVERRRDLEAEAGRTGARRPASAP